MNCREALQHLYEYLDHELSDDVAKKIKNHLSTCEHCFETFEFEQHLQEMVSSKGKLEVHSDELKVKVMDRIRELDQEANSAGFFSRYRPYLAAAAAIIFIAVGLFNYLPDQSSKVHAAVSPFLNGHKHCVECLHSGESAPMTVQEIDSCLTSMASVRDTFLKPSEDRSPKLGIVEDCGDMKAAHLVFQYSGSEVSVYVVQDSCFSPPEGMQMKSMENHTYFYDSLDGLNVVLWECRGMWCVAVSQLESGSIMEFASVY